MKIIMIFDYKQDNYREYLAYVTVTNFTTLDNFISVHDDSYNIFESLSVQQYYIDFENDETVVIKERI